MEIMYPNIAGVNYESMADGTGMRAAIFLSGCSHHCPGCHNRQAQDPQFGSLITDRTVDEIASNIVKRHFIRGITLTGGDPLYAPEKTLHFMQELDDRLPMPYTVWLYTGYTWEEIKAGMKKDSDLRTLIHDFVDVVVDGPFVADLADRTLAFRGSSNQRIIDAKETLKSGKVVLWQ